MQDALTTHENILICDDHPVCCVGLKASIEALPFIQPKKFFFAHTGEDAINLIEKNSFSFIFIDLKLPKMSGLETIEKIKSLIGPAKVVIFTGQTDSMTIESVRKSLYKLPIHALLQKTYSLEKLTSLFHHLSSASDQVYFDPDILALLTTLEETTLTQRETEVVQLIVRGLTTNEIAQKLRCSPETIKSHRSNILSKTQTRNVAELSAWYSDRYGKSDSRS